MTRFDFGAVVLVPFPFTDQSASKRRPAVVVSTSAYGEERPDIVVMAITSQLRAESKFDWAIEHWQEAGLLKPSAIKPVIATIEQSLVLKALGALDDADRAGLRKLLAEIVG
jgi:mRNA interferase MazF